MKRKTPPSCTVVQLELADGTTLHDKVDCGNPDCPTSDKLK
jgi:hypothetical protein